MNKILYFCKIFICIIYEFVDIGLKIFYIFVCICFCYVDIEEYDMIYVCVLN